MTTFYALRQNDKWYYVIEPRNELIELGDIVTKNSLYEEEREHLQLIGEVDVEALNRKIREIAGGGFSLYETPLSNIFTYREATKIIFGKDGRIYTFRKPEDILKLKFVPVRLGYFFKDVTPEILRAWEEHQSYCRAEAIITTDPDVWRQAYRDIRSCMQYKEEIEFYIENPHAFEIGVLIDKKDNRVFARTVIYKTQDGNRYYKSIYSDRPHGKLVELLESENIKLAQFGNYKLPMVTARSEIGIPYMDAFCYGKVIDIERKNNEKIWYIIFKNIDYDYDLKATFTHGTDEMLYRETRCWGCQLYTPNDYLTAGYCEDCVSEERCCNCGAYEVYENELCYECYREEYIRICELCDEEHYRDDIREVLYISFWDDTPNEREVYYKNVCYHCVERNAFQNLNELSESLRDLWRSDNLAIVTINEEEVFAAHTSEVEELIERLLQRKAECEICGTTLEKYALRRVQFGRFNAQEGCYMQEKTIITCLSCVNSFCIHNQVNRDLIASKNMTVYRCWVDNNLSFVVSELHNNQIFAVPSYRMQDFVGELHRQYTTQNR